MTVDPERGRLLYLNYYPGLGDIRTRGVSLLLFGDEIFVTKGPSETQRTKEEGSEFPTLRA